MAFDDLTGRTFGRWTVIRKSYSKDHRLYWLCECSCDDHTRRDVWASDLRREGSTSCGCLMRQLTSERATKHGMAHHRVYCIWQQMRDRCNNPNSNGYHLYGGRGITVCERWDSFASFWEDMGPTYQDDLSIDRIDTNGNYEPTNCRWATAKEQANNRRDNRIIDTPAGRMNVTQAAKQFGLKRMTIYARIAAGWDESDLLYKARPLIRR